MPLLFLITKSTVPFHPAVKWERLIPCSISSSVLCVSLEIIAEISIKSFQPKCGVFIIADAGCVEQEERALTGLWFF